MVLNPPQKYKLPHILPKAFPESVQKDYPLFFFFFSVKMNSKP